MSSEFEVHLFHDDASIIHIGEGLLARTLPREEWTHEAHLAACTWICLDRPDIVLERDFPGIISRYKEAVGGVNDDRQGYHETIKQVYIAGFKAHLAEAGSRKPEAGSRKPEAGSAMPLHETVNALLLGPRGRGDWPLRFYSKELLFSVAARRGFVEPDRTDFDEI